MLRDFPSLRPRQIMTRIITNSFPDTDKKYSYLREDRRQGEQNFLSSSSSPSPEKYLQSNFLLRFCVKSWSIEWIWQWDFFLSRIIVKVIVFSSVGKTFFIFFATKSCRKKVFFWDIFFLCDDSRVTSFRFLSLNISCYITFNELKASYQSLLSAHKNSLCFQCCGRAEKDINDISCLCVYINFLSANWLSSDSLRLTAWCFYWVIF